MRKQKRFITSLVLTTVSVDRLHDIARYRWDLIKPAIPQIFQMNTLPLSRSRVMRA
jgi:hypothetical protein